MAELLSSYPALLMPPQYKQRTDSDVYHCIKTTGHPVYEKARRLPFSIEREVRDEFSNMIEAGICQPSKSQWASPIVVVKKPNKKIRIVGDYRHLNAQTILDRYPLPHLIDSFKNLYGKTIFHVST